MNKQQMVPNLVQGVSQQAAQNRRATQAEAQFDMLNHSVAGAVARPPLEFHAKLRDGEDWRDAFWFDMLRDDDERYSLAIKGGVLRVFNFKQGVECLVETPGDVSAYLVAMSGGNLDWDNWTATSAEDDTFIANKTIFPLMDDTALSPTRPQEALFWFRAGNYKVTYTIRIKIGGVWHEWTYETPDNSVEANAEFIQTDNIAEAFYTAMTTGPGDLASLGLSAQLDGNIIRVFYVPGAVVMSGQSPFTGGGSLSAGTQRTMVNRSWTVPNNKVLRQVAIYSWQSGIFKFKIMNEDSPTQFDELWTSANLTHPGGGWKSFTLPTGTFTTPAGGTLRAAVYNVSGGPTGGVYPVDDRAVKNGNVLGSNQSGFTASTTAVIPLRTYTSDASEVVFDIETSDGNNNTQLSGIKGEVRSLEDLPRNGFDGMVFKVSGDVEEDADDWYVEFVSKSTDADSTTQGAWEETIAPGTKTSLLRNTMPLLLKNVSPNLFQLSFGTWGKRVAGDGIDSAKDPSFINRPIEDLFYDKRRLGIETKAGALWSRVNNPFVFFPDTVQLSLASARIDVQATVNKTIAVCRKVVQTDANTYLWAEGLQLGVLYGDNAIFSATTIDIKPSSSFEWNPKVQPIALGAGAVLFANSTDYSNIVEAVFQSGRAVADTLLTEHVPSYIPADIRQFIASDTAKKAFVLCKSTPNMAYIYEWRLGEGASRVQSAWHTWRLPVDSEIMHMVFDGARVYAYVHRPTDGLMLYTFTVSPTQIDPGEHYQTRMDFRLTEAQVSMSYNAGTEETTVTLPHSWGDAVPFDLYGTNKKVVAVIRANTDGRFRGEEITVNSIPDATHVVLDGDLTDAQFYIGLRIRASRREGTFYVRDEQTGYVHMDRIGVNKAHLGLSSTGYTRGEVYDVKEDVRASVSTEGRMLGSKRTEWDALTLYTGNFELPINEANEDCSVEFINDSWMPSAWTSLGWWYDPTARAAL